MNDDGRKAFEHIISVLQRLVQDDVWIDNLQFEAEQHTEQLPVNGFWGHVPTGRETLSLTVEYNRIQPVKLEPTE